MVVFVDLDDEADPPESGFYAAEYQAQAAFERDGLRDLDISEPAAWDVQMANPNRNSITEVFACYPAVTMIASLIDLNTLDNLSRTCHQIRENLLQFRSQLIVQTLHCCNEDVEPNHDHTLRYRARAADWYFMEEGGVNVVGKVGNCARDMVAECRRCKRVVCRNCTIKPPAPILLRHRHRRLCPRCIKAPLPSLLSPPLSLSAPLAKETVKCSVCVCATSGVWLCQPCGRGLRSADNTYDSIWRWRTRYAPALGGLGIGEGNRTFECGRAQECCAAQTVEEEIDCDAQDARETEGDRDGNGGRSVARVTLSTSPTPSSGSNKSERMRPGYSRHEIEGIGGVVKKKLVRMVKVGACVNEYDDERDQGRYLIREMDGNVRSWCGWCWRVVAGVKDRAEWEL